MREHFSIKRKSFKILISIFVFVQIVGMLVMPVSVSAQAGAVTILNPSLATTPATAAPQPVFDWGNYWAQWQIYGQQEAKKEVDQGIGAAAVGALIHSASFYADKIAYDLGNALAHGGKGMGSLLQKYRSGDYFEKIALDAVGDFVENFSKDAIGIGLCQMPDPKLLIQLTLGFKQMYGSSPKSDCEWQNLKNNWSEEAFESRYGPGGKNFLAETFSGSLKVTNSDFGVGLEAIAKLDRFVAKKEEAAKAEDLKGDGFKDLTTMISGKIETPSFYAREQSKVLTGGYRQQISSTQLAGVMGSGFKNVFIHAGSVFLNTLVGEMINRALTECWLDCEGDGADYESIASGSNLSPLRSRFDDPSNLFNKLIAARPTTQINDFDIVSEFATCPESPGINNCVIDTNFEKILSMGRNSQPMTIQEALDNGSLDGNMPLISPRREADNTSKDCYLGKLCYSNIQKLRKVRILPLGFEIAALRSDPDNPWKLKDVVAGFENCNRVDANGNSNPNGPYIKEDAAFPYCHLINPNWILRVPPLFCEAQVYTNSLTTPNGPDRQKECVDVKTCINEGENGSCGGYYAYCTKEKNVWNIPGDTCPAEYNTCTAYTNTQNRKQSAYLSRTVDYGECSLENTGCRAYSMRKDENNVWLAKSEEINGLNLRKNDPQGYDFFVFFDDGMKKESGVCKQGSNGCTAFYPAKKFEENGQYQKSLNKFVQDVSVADAGNFVYLKKAPDYLGCYDGIKDASPQIDWPQNQSEIVVAESSSPECSKYASVCTEEEVGCEGFTQMGASNSPQIPGQIGALNVCDESCVGYSTFKQESTKFAEEQFPLYFIPKQAESCSAKYVGCEEFTNIEAAGQGGEKLEYYTDLKYCEKPLEDNSNIKTFYTWEGSIREGLTLRTHKVLPLRQEEVDFLNGSVFVPNNVGGVNVTPEESREMQNEFIVGSPAYGDDTKKAIVEAYRQCNAVNYTERINSPYSINAAEPDCKAFYDDAGSIFYRLLGSEETSANKLVMVDASCHNLRKTVARLVNDEVLQGKSNLCLQKGGVYDDASDNCQRCINGGRYENNFCIYRTISKPGESMSCQGPENNPGKYNGCRAYTGSTANNLREIFEEENFEIDANATPEQIETALGSWAPRASLRISPESTDAGKHSLEFSGGNTTLSRTISAETSLVDGWYELEFWAKGQGTAEVTLSQLEGQVNVVRSRFTFDTSVGENVPVSFTNDWQAYKLGPVEFSGTTSTDMILNFNFSENQNGRFYIDHVLLSQVRDVIPLKEKSWQQNGKDVSEMCDSAPNDGLPGEALGCAAYKDTNQRIRFATGFERLCRQKAIGCEPLWDTHNTITGDDATTTQAFNVRCVVLENNNNGNGRLDAANNRCILQKIVGANRVDDAGCVLPNPWVKECIVPKVSLKAGESLLANFSLTSFVPSTIIIPSDTPKEAPIFLANRKEFQCKDAERGCMVVGQEEQILSDESSSSSFKYTDVLVKNDPEKYGETLCRSDLVGCSEYKSSKGLTYFKDPVVTGNKLCVYREKREGDQSYGWFQNGVGKCVGSESLCRSKSDCAANVECVIGNVACSPDAQDQAGMFDLWSNKTENYRGFVGTCPVKYDMCTELFDPADTSPSNPNGQPYYVIFNKLVTDKSSECEGKVSLTNGCVLFDKTDEPNKLFNSVATYVASENANPKYSSVLPSQSGTKDSNLILKVDRDRMCSRWLDCSSKVNHTVNGKTESVCYSFRECEKISGNICVKWVDDFETDKNIRESQKRLTYFEYVNRGTSWYDVEYTGYSMYDKYRIQNMIYVVPNYEALVTSEHISPWQKAEFDDVQYIAYVMDSQFFSDADFQGNGCDGKPAWDVCGFDQGGRCYTGQCIYPISGVFAANAVAYTDVQNRTPNKEGFFKILNALQKNSCKGYPEAKAPFSQDVVFGGKVETLHNGNKGTRYTFTEKLTGYNDVNVCQGSKDCSCGYKKVMYSGGETDFLSFENALKSTGICSGGKKILPQKGLTEMEGYPCSTNSDCGEDAGANAASSEATESGRCMKVNKTETQYGLKGYCLEQDLSRPLGLKNYPYACLTWLPIGVSASSQDIYNTAIEAGYNPDEGSGKLFCAQSTGYNAKPTDGYNELPGYMGKNTINAAGVNFLEPGYFGSVNQGGRPFVPRLASAVQFQNIGGAQIPVGRARTCENIYESDRMFQSYVGMICEDIVPSYGRMHDFSAFIQEYGWKTFGHNTILLRNELTVSQNIDPRENTRGPVIDPTGNVNRAASEVIPLALLARNWSEVTMGTFMHPPRFFDNIDNSLETDYSYFRYTNPATTNFNMLAWEAVRNRKIYTAAFSPGNKIRPYVGANVLENREPSKSRVQHSLYRSDLEERLYEKDIKKIHFITTAIEGGLDESHAQQDQARAPDKERRSLVPEIFGLENFIDFEYLREKSKGSSGNVGYIRQSFKSTNCWNGYAAGENAESDGYHGEEFPRMKGEYIGVNGIGTDTSFTSVTGESLGESADEQKWSCEPEPGDDYYGWGRKDFKGIRSWTYRVTRQYMTENNFSNINYPDTAEVGVRAGGFEDASDKFTNPRNMVETRYVWVFYDTEQSPGSQNDQDSLYENFFPKCGQETPCDTSAPTEKQDPFSDKLCSKGEPSEGRRSTPYLAIGLDFNSQGEFLGYITKNCNTKLLDFPGVYNIPQLAVFAEVKDQCLEFVKVYDDTVAGGPLTGFTNKAWTNRTWKGAGAYYDFIPGAGGNGNGYGEFFKRSGATYNYPFSSLANKLDNDEIFDIKRTPVEGDAAQIAVAKLENENLARKLMQYTFEGAPFLRGLPYSCNNKSENDFYVGDEFSAGFQNGNCVGGSGQYLSATDDTNINRTNRDQAITNIKKIFAKFYDKFSFNADMNQYDSIANTYKIKLANGNVVSANDERIESAIPDDATASDRNVALNNELRPPQIYSLNPAKCRFTSSGSHCTAAEENAITVNYRNGTMTDYDGDGREGDEDVDGDRVPDAIIQNQSVSAIVNFFAWGNDNRMPIRSVKVDWNDGRTPITNQNTKGLYKNRKPVCFKEGDTQTFCSANGSDTEAIKKGLACKEGDCMGGEKCDGLAASYGNRFGSYSPDACEEGYFEFVHDYTCTRGDIPPAGQRPIGTKERYVKQVGDDSVIDTKTAEKLYRLGLTPTSWVCVFKPRVQVMDNWEWCNGSCGPNAVAGVNSGCYEHEIIAGVDNQTCTTGADRAWTTYRGSIIVIPPTPLLQAAGVRVP